jgi:minor extracellular serine protease Vpr
MQKQISSILISTLLIAGCTNSTPSELKNAGFLDGLYSTRPTVEEPMMAILKLSNPALLESAEKKDGKIVVDQELVAAIKKEQEDTVEALKKISSDIRVLIRYKLVLNGMAIWAPASVFEKIRALPNVTLSEKSTGFGRPALAETKDKPKVKNKGIVGPKTSVKFIGAEKAYAENIKGEGMKVGIIDTGIDYTHKMFLGEGTEAAYKAIDPKAPNAAFPNKKVVGGIDLAGTNFNSASPDWKNRIPVPDANPLDEAAHGTHVAGTVAGLGDGVNTYDGVAPAAELYAIKVFGANGSTSDEVVIAALEYAADPTGDLSFKDQLDVVNLSLGSGYGNPHIMYNQAISNLVRGGTIVVASGGNSGDQKFIVGAPGVSDDAISVASSVDNMNQNIQFKTVSFLVGEESFATSEFTESADYKSLDDTPEVKGEVIYAGLGDKPFSEELAAQVKGRIALMDRGAGIGFVDKVAMAEKAGAIAVVIANNVDEDPITMGGPKEKNGVPAIMITKKAGDAIKAKMTEGTVVTDLKVNGVLEKPWLIDTISSFSSRGPRSEDGLIKPEISSPGSNIISADVGSGDGGALMSGTSMAGPHIAGVMALLKQKYKDLNSYELKSVLLGHGKVIADKEKKQYSVSRQGAGRVQVDQSIDAKLVSVPSTLSLGITDIEKQKTLSQELTLKNISAETLTLTPVWKGSDALKVTTGPVTLAAGESKTITVKATIVASLLKSANDEIDGYLTLVNDKETVLQIPALALVRQISQVQAKSVVVHATSRADAAGSFAEVELKNAGVNKGSAYLFNLLGTDSRKKDLKPDAAHNKNCDLQSAGYRLIQKDGKRVLQVALKLFEGMTTWNTCEVNVQIDANKDGITDQELAGLPMGNLPGLSGDKFVSLLLDGTKARELRNEYEAKYAIDPTKAAEDYSSAAIAASPMKMFDNATLAIIETDASLLAISDTGELNLKISTTHQDSGALEYDDYLGTNDKKWQKISVSEMGQAFAQIPEVIELAGQESKTVSLQTGYGAESLVLYAPQNRGVRDPLLEDSQSQIVPVTFEDAK